jgi:NRPS condensation-like uncharacterized protein
VALPPRPLTCAEESVWFSDRRGDPRIVVLIAHLQGSVDERLLLAGLSAALSELPLLGSYPSRQWPGVRRYVWKPTDIAPGRLVTIKPGGDDTVRELVEQMRLAVAKMRPGLAVGIVRRTDGDRVLLVVHHALTDGIGALSLLSRLLTTDSAYKGRAAHSIRPDRDHSEPALCGTSVSAHRPPVDDGSRWPFSLLAPDRLAGACAFPLEPGYGFVDATVALGRPPAASTINDVLIAATSLAIDRWNVAHGRATDRLTVHVPIRSRPLPHHAAGLGNATGQAVIVTRAHERREGRLVARVVEQTQWAKGIARQPSVAERVVSTLQWTPAGLRRRALQAIRRLTGRWLMPSVTISNLGRVDAAFADRQLKSLTFLTTAGMPQGIAVTAAGVDRDVTLAVTYVKKKLNAPAAHSFLGLIVDAISELAPDGYP